jgi:hypothetical protein
MTIDTELESPNGPRVRVTGEAAHEEILSALPDGWTVHDDDWSNGVKLTDGSWSYPLSRGPVPKSAP